MFELQPRCEYFQTCIERQTQVDVSQTRSAGPKLVACAGKSGIMGKSNCSDDPISRAKSRIRKRRTGQEESEHDCE